MAKWSYTDRDGNEYEIDAPSEEEADKKFQQGLKGFNQSAAEEREQANQAKQQKYQQDFDIATTPWQKLNARLNQDFGGINSLFNRIPGNQVMKDFVSPSLAKGIVGGAGRFVPQTPELTQYEKDYPKIAKGLNVAAGIGSALPAAGAVSVRAGAGFLPQFMGQGTLNTGLNVADKMAEKGAFNISPEDAASAGKWGFGSAVLPAAFTKVAGQAERPMTKDLQNAWRESIKQNDPDIFRNAIMSRHYISRPPIQSAIAGAPEEAVRAGMGIGGAALGGGLGYGSGHAPDLALLGLFGGEALHRALGMAPQLTSNVRGAMQQPGTQDILRALMSQSQPMMTQPDQP